MEISFQDLLRNLQIIIIKQLCKEQKHYLPVAVVVLVGVCVLTGGVPGFCVLPGVLVGGVPGICVLTRVALVTGVVVRILPPPPLHKLQDFLHICDIQLADWVHLPFSDRMSHLVS